MKRLGKRSKRLRLRSSVKAFRVSFRSRFDWRSLADTRPPLSEEFSIYLNYVRKLGFEETPDYDFLRELFAKVMKNNGDIDDQVYDWNLLNGMSSYLACHHRRMLNGWFAGGRGWESSGGQNNQTLQQVQSAQNPNPRKSAIPVPPSPALVRHGSSKITAPLMPNSTQVPGQLTPISGVAQVNISIAPNRLQERVDGSYVGNQTYDRASPMVSTIQHGPVPVSANLRTGLQTEETSGQGENEPPKFSLWKILTCKCS